MDPRYALPPPAGSTAGPAARVGAAEVWGIFRRRRWVIVGCFLAALAAGYFLTRRMEPVYEASARILVEGESPAVTALPAREAAPRESPIGTEMQILQSRELVEAVADSLQVAVRVTEPQGVPRSKLFSRVHIAEHADKARYRFERRQGGRFAVTDAASGERVAEVAPGAELRLPEGTLVLDRRAARYEEIEVEITDPESAADRVQAGLEITQPSREAQVIQVAYRGSDPELVRDIPNALTARFITLRRQQRSSEARTTAHFLRGQLDTLRVQLTAAENRLRSFREREQVVDLPMEASAQVSRQAQMEAERGVLEAERASLAALLSQAQVEERAQGDKPDGPSPYRRLMASPSLLRNPAAAEMLSGLTRLEDERAALLSRRKPTDPEVQVLTRRIEQMENEIAGLVTTYQKGLAGQVASIDATLGRFERRLDRVPGKEVEFARLSRQTKVLEEMYGLLQMRLKEAEIREAVQDPSVRVMDPARRPMDPVAPRKGLILGGAGLFGLLLGIALSFVREVRDGTVRSRDELRAATGLPVLGWIPRIEEIASAGASGVRRLAARRGGKALPPGAGTPRLPAPGDASLPAAEAYEWLHRNLLFARQEARVKTLLVTSPLPGDGKTTTAAGLAVTLARRGHKVLLIDADLRRGAVSALFQRGQGKGLSDLLAGTASFADVVKTTDVGGGKTLHYVPAGSLPPDPAQLLGSLRAPALFEWLSQKYYMIIVDSAPINVFADAAVLGEHADGVVLVGRAGITPYEALVHSAEQCRRANLPVLGTILNDVDAQKDRDYDAAYRWYEYAKSYNYARVES